MPAIPVLAGMEVSGVVFLPERVTRFSHALDRHLDDLRRTASAAAGGADFNLASPDQVCLSFEIEKERTITTYRVRLPKRGSKVICIRRDVTRT